MSEHVVRNLPVLKRLKRLSAAKRNKYIRTCSSSQIICLSECCKNLLLSNIPVSGKQLKKLARHKRSLRTLACKKTGLKTRRHILQKGGLLPLILAPILSVLATVVGGAINRSLEKRQ